MNRFRQARTMAYRRNTSTPPRETGRHAAVTYDDPQYHNAHLLSNIATISDKNFELGIGYDLRFVDDVQQYTCAICLYVVRLPVQTSCGHRFCRHCLDTLIKTRYMCSRWFRCPIDKESLDCSKVYTDVAYVREVLGLMVRCGMSDDLDDCDWVGELRDIKSHEKNCPARKIVCPVGCGQQIRYRCREEHMDRCPSRFKACLHCQGTFDYKDIEAHRKICDQAPITCPDCNVQIIRTRLEKHQDKSFGDCPKTVLDCRYKNIGCQVQFVRQQTEAHMHVAMAQHLDLLFVKYTALSSVKTSMDASTSPTKPKDATTQEQSQGQ